MSDAKVIKDFLKAAPGLIESLKKPMADLHYAIRELQSVTDDYEDLPPDIQEFLDYAENAVNQYLRANRSWDDCRDELEKMSKAPTVKGKTVPKVPEAFGSAGKGEEDFVKRVKAAVASIPKNEPTKGGWSDHKVFIWAVREKLKMDKKEFQTKLLDANRLGLVSLTRFDAPMVLESVVSDKKAREELMRKYREDSINSGGSTFDFIGR